MTQETIELARELLKLSDREIGITASGGFGQHKKYAFLRDLNKILEEVAGTKRPFHIV